MLDPRRGDIVRVRFDPVEGSEQAGERPAIVLSPDFINARAPIIIIAPLTSRKTDRLYPYEALIEPPDGGLTICSKAMLLHVRGIARSRVIAHHGRVADETMRRVEEALALAIGLRGV
ncbi:MAG: type II toxin-antitoxin system PemK/MazF family toxin [Chthonomonadales bacterium]|nr:type II toxin-antitoxin system PemK/MazF family toxin [Chthonomonadales bacterium]